jgi:glycine/D-amino acid oxidase-like deaminating enzyme
MYVETRKLEPRQRRQRAKSAVVVGAGIVGLSVARELACKGVHVTVVEREEKAGSVATAKSWAWLNANGKQPLEYQQFSMMAMVR